MPYTISNANPQSKPKNIQFNLEGQTRTPNEKDVTSTLDHMDFSLEPYLSSYVPFPMHDLMGCSIFTLNTMMRIVSFILSSCTFIL